MGERAPETLEQLRACSSCLTELEAFDETLTQFRLSVHEEAAARTPTDGVGTNPPPRGFSGASPTVCATIAIVLGASRLGKSPERHRSRIRPPPTWPC